MKRWILALFLVVAFGITPLTSHGQTPFEFCPLDGNFIIQIDNDHYLVSEDIRVNGKSYWAQWKFNLSNGNWDLVDAGVPTPGLKSSRGYYFYDSSKKIMIWEIEASTFLGCEGPEAGTHVFHTNFSEPSLNLLSIEVGNHDDDDSIEINLIRVSGSPGEIHGQWKLELGPNVYTADFNADGSLLIIGDIKDCDLQ